MAARGESLDRVANQPEANRDAGDHAGLDRVPGFIDAILQAARFRDRRERRFEQNALRRLRQDDGADRQLLIVMEQERQRIAEGAAIRIDDIAHPIELRRRRDTGEHASLGIDRLDRQEGVGAIHRATLTPHVTEPPASSCKCIRTYSPDDAGLVATDALDPDVVRTCRSHFPSCFGVPISRSAIAWCRAGLIDRCRQRSIVLNVTPTPTTCNGADEFVALLLLGRRARAGAREPSRRLER